MTCKPLKERIAEIEESSNNTQSYFLVLEGGFKIEFDENVKINGFKFRPDSNYTFEKFMSDKLFNTSKLTEIETCNAKYYLMPHKIICIQVK